ncbi:hypothetical protein IAG44_39415 [Streptomyces roseirectus]|uniref:Gcp-like domain-containing protein n=1 Tax=Streptomyces roseirectus TaxID=2768066 RepID=A0A7H0ITN3_9ACTN|nr:hypothetical protein IAG44_39415 [Streptomyces roseirectus]
MAEHARYGGIVPEIASRAHLHVLRPVVRQPLDAAGSSLGDVGAIAGPGLSGAGVAANSRVRSRAEERCRAAGITLRVPPLRLRTDNGVMTAAVGDLLVRAAPAPLDVAAPLENAALHPVAVAA